MAHKMKAISLTRPRLKLTKRVGINDVSAYIASRASLNKGTVMNVLSELQATIAHFTHLGMAVKFEGIGVFSPMITLYGDLKIILRQDRELRDLLGNYLRYEKEIVNRDNVGKTPDELIALWNEENPTDPVDIPPVP